MMRRIRNIYFVVFTALALSGFSDSALAATSLPFTINMSENVIVDTAGGTPRVAIDVGGVTRYAAYTSGSGSSSLVFTYNAVPGDVDLDGVTLSSPLQLNGGTMRDAVGNDAVLTFTPPNTANVRINYPSLSMNFIADSDGRFTVNGTVHNTLSAFLSATGGTFSRGSIGTYYDSSGVLQTAASGVPRFDHDPVTLNPRGILIEESRTNHILNSNDISLWTTSFQNGTAGGTVVAPDGSSNGRIITLGSGQYYYGRTPNAMPLGNYTASAWLKGTPGYNVAFRISSVSSGSNSAYIVVPLTNTWTRVSVSFNLTIANSPIDIGVDDRFTGNLGGTVHVFGGQIENGLFATSYIPTGGSAVTRAAENMSISNAGWFNQSAGAFTATANTLANNGAYPAFLGGASMIWGWRTGDGGLNVLGVRALSPSLVDTRTNVAPGNAVFNFAMGYTDGTSLSAVGNGGTVVTNSLNTMQAQTFLNIGKFDNGSIWNGHIRKASYYPLRPVDTQLQFLSQ